MGSSNTTVAFLLTLIAGLSTGLGSLLALVTKAKSSRYLSFFLGIASGVMIYVSFMEILPEAISNLQNNYGNKIGMQYAVFSFFGGMWLSAFIDGFVPKSENSIAINKLRSKYTKKINFKLYRTGIISAIIIALHNFPEGIATFMTAINSPRLAFPVAFAIALHNIPEGITISAPIYYATGDRKRAFAISFITGLSEPLGAIIAYFILARFMNDILFGIIFGAVAGIMIYISFDELLPSAHEYGEHKYVIYGLVIGMAVMATSLVMFA